MRFELFLGLRYLKAKRKQAFISVITVISMAGVMVGVMSLIVVLSVMNGFRADLMSKILGVNSPLLVLDQEGAFSAYQKVEKEIRSVPGVKGVTPFIYGTVMVNNMGNASGAVLRGLDTRSVGKVIAIKHMIKSGSLDSLNRTHKGLPGVIMGKELARSVGLFLGQEVTLVSPQGKLTPLGRVPNSRRFRVTGIFDSGMYDYDASMLYVSLKEAQDFLGMGDRVSGLEVQIKDVQKSGIVGEAIQKKLGFPFWTKDWKTMNRSLVSALRLEKVAMSVILTMIILVGALNIISTLVMVVMEKSRDVAILRTMGATARSIMSVFIFQGLLVGVVGTLVGLGAGLGICDLLAKYKFISLPADVYYISTLPVKVEMNDVIFVIVASVIISFLATIYPSWHASRQNPVEALRYE